MKETYQTLLRFQCAAANEILLLKLHADLARADEERSDAIRASVKEYDDALKTLRDSAPSLTATPDHSKE